MAEAGGGDVVVHQADGDELEPLVGLARAFYDESGFTTGEAELRARFARYLGAPDARVAVASDAGGAYAFALTTTTTTLESGVVAELQDLYVRPEYRRRGVASALIEDAAGWARARGASILELVVAPNGQDVSHLLAFYGARGFVDEERRLLVRPLPSASADRGAQAR